MKESIRDYTNATRFDDWLVKVCGLNEAGYLLPRWRRVWVFFRYFFVKQSNQRTGE